MSLTLRVAAATKATAAAQEARPARAMGLPAVETAWTRNGEERAPTSASRFTRDAEVTLRATTGWHGKFNRAQSAWCLQHQ